MKPYGEARSSELLQFGCHCHHHGDSLNSHPFPFQRPSTSWALPALSSQSGVSLLVLICIWLIANHVNYLSVCLPPVCVSFLGDVCLPLCPLCCHTVCFSPHHFVADPCVSLRPVRCRGCQSLSSIPSLKSSKGGVFWSRGEDHVLW